MKLKAAQKENILRFTGSALTLLALLPAVSLMQPGLALAACLAALWWPMERAKVHMTGLMLILLQDIALRHGNTQGILAALLFLALAGELLILYSQRANANVQRLLDALHPPRALYPAVSLGAAVLMTLYQGSGYFAIGAHGAGGLALMKSYGLLGFHPNWRTVLFSTVMLLALIAWPRKFRSLSRVLPAGAIGIFLVIALNLILNPEAARSTVAELPGRIPSSALSMLLIFTAWEEVPWQRLKHALSARLNLTVLAVIPIAMFGFDLLWVFVGLGLMWDGVCVARIVRVKIKKPASA
jgi:MFS superfamily sulfate permease-like transporter